MGVSYRDMGLNLTEEQKIDFNNGYIQGLAEGKLIGRIDALEEMKTIVKELCFGFKASQGNLVRVDVVEQCIIDKLNLLRTQNNGD